MIFMNACNLVSSNYKGLYLACIIQTYGCLLLHRPFLAMRMVSGMSDSAQNWSHHHSMVDDGSGVEFSSTEPL